MLLRLATPGDRPAGCTHRRRGRAVTNWRPLVSGTARQRTLQTVDAIAESVTSRSPGERALSLAGGQAGLAVLYAWLARARGDARAAELARDHLDEAIEGLAHEVMGSSFWSGFTGIAWAADVVGCLLDGPGEDGGAAVDDAVARVLSRRPVGPVSHDLVAGLTGLGVYALQRRRRPVAAECVHRIVERLTDIARQDDDGVFWWTDPAHIWEASERERYPSGRADLGVAHGVPGVIALLGALCGAGVERATVRPLLEGAVRWLLAQAVETASGPTFPIWVAPGFEPVPARTAWCYGDPGVAAALWTAAQGAGEPEWAREAVALACRAAERPVPETGVVDASVCHGTAGLAHVYNRLYQASGEPQLARAAIDWLERTLDWCDLARSSGGQWVTGTPDLRAGPWTGIGVVGGAAGIALVLLAAATPVEPSWDQVFLLSAPRDSEVRIT
ncbi:lanthionine synthetase C family protein [Geodermatophilus sp. URMC 61]|uniref:lanthionine synthetase C family protein n=1 Tax=Geodermatophilus sp. URMC 61 TaxID=3423411 RepID=UPI00406C5A2A